MNTSPAISVIIPVYKAEQYLPRCIDSLLAQRFSDYEVLLVDDGSPDRSGEICEEYARKDSRIRVFHQANQGVSAARNKGLEEALGRYISFADPDDRVQPTYLQHLYDALHPEQGAGVVMAGFQLHTASGEKQEGKQLPEGVFPASNIPEVFRAHQIYRLGYVWSKLFEASVIREHALRFDPRIRCLEDALFTYRYLLKCDYIATSTAQDYIYIKYPRSLSSSLQTFEEIQTGIELFKPVFSEFTSRWALSREVIFGMYEVIAIFLEWGINADYVPYRKVKRSLRIEHLRVLVSDNHSFFANNYLPAYKADKLGKWLLLKQLYGIYDFYRLLLYRTKLIPSSRF